MTSTVKVTAHCAPNNFVHIVKQNAAGTVGETLNLPDGESWEGVVYDDFKIEVTEHEHTSSDTPQP